MKKIMAILCGFLVLNTGVGFSQVSSSGGSAGSTIQPTTQATTKPKYVYHPPTTQSIAAQIARLEARLAYLQQLLNMPNLPAQGVIAINNDIAKLKAQIARLKAYLKVLEGGSATQPSNSNTPGQ